MTSLDTLFWRELIGSIKDGIISLTINKMSTTILATIINLAVTLLPLIGITVDSTSLETTIQTLVALGTGIWIWYQRVKSGGVSKLGVRK